MMGLQMKAPHAHSMKQPTKMEHLQPWTPHERKVVAIA